MNKKQDIDVGSINHQLIGNDLFKNSNIHVEFFNNMRLNIITLKKGEILFREGDSANSIFLILDGDLNLINKQDAENNCIFVSKNDFFGNREFLQLVKRNSIAVALKDSKIVELSREDIDYLIKQDNILMKNLQHEQAYNEANINLAYSGELIKNHDPDYPFKQNLIEKIQLIQHSDQNPIINEDSKMNNRNYSDLNKIKSELNSIINNLIEHSSALEEEQKKFRRLLSDYESDNKKLHIEIGKLKEQKESFFNLDKEKTEILGYQSYRIIELEKEIIKLRSIEQDYAKNFEISRIAVKENANKLKLLETELEEKKVFVAVLEKNFEESKKTLSYLNEVQLSLIQKADEQDELVKEQNSRLTDSLERIGIISSDLAQKEKLLTELKNEIAQKDKLVSEYKEKENGLKEELLTVQKRVESLSAETTELNNQLLEKNKTISEYSQKETKLKDEMVDLSNKFNSLNSQFSEQSSFIQSLKTDLENKANIISDQTNKFAAAKLENEKLLLSNHTNEETIKEQSHKISELQKNMLLVEDKERDARNELSSQSKKILEYENQINISQNESGQKDESIKKLTIEVKTLNEELKKTKADISNRNKTIDELRSEFLTIKKSSEDFSNKETSLKKEIVDLKFHLSKANSKLASFAEQLKEKTDHNQGKEAEFQEIKKQLEEHGLLINEKDREVGDLLLLLEQRDSEVAQLNKLNDELNSQKSGYVSLNEAFDRLKNENSYLSEQLKNFKLQIEANRTEQKNLLRISADYNRLKDEEEKYKNSISEHNKLITRQKEEYVSLNDTLNLLKSENERLIEQLNNSKHQFKENENEYNKLLKISVEYNGLKDEVEKHKKVLAEKERIIKEQTDLIDDFRLNNSEIVHTLNATKNKFGDELGIKDNKILALENSLNDLKNVLEEKTAFEDQQSETINNQAQKIAELELKLSEKTTKGTKADDDENFDQQLKPLGDDSEEQPQVSDDDKIFSKCKLIKSKPIDPDVLHETFEHFQYFDIHIVNVNLTRATIDMVSAFNEFLQEIVSRDENRIIVNLSQCEFIDSSFLGLLVANLKKVTAKGGDMRLVGFHPTVTSMMQLTRMDKIFEFYPKVEAALKSFG